MGMTFEGSSLGTGFTQDVTGMSRKAMQLNELVERIAAEVAVMDEQVKTIAAKGIKGSAMSRAMGTYVENRNIINKFVKKFATTACILSESAIEASNINEGSEGAAAGV